MIVLSVNRSNCLYRKNTQFNQIVMKILLLLISVFWILELNGQNSAMDHLFKDESKNLSVFINPTCQFSQIVGDYAIIPGIRTGVILHRTILLGALYNFTAGDTAVTSVLVVRGASSATTFGVASVFVASAILSTLVNETFSVR